MKRRDFMRTTAVLTAGWRVGPAIIGQANAIPNAQLLEQIDVFISGTGYHTYRIPSIVTTREGVMLAFCEGRQTRSDHSENDLLLRRSTDEGLNWEEMRVVVEDGRNALLNPMAVVLRKTGRVLLMYQRYPEGCHVDCVKYGFEDELICRTLIVHSDDEGRSWSVPRDITQSVKRPEMVTATPGGPGVGIQLRSASYAGRILMPFVNQIDSDRAREVCVVYSDDEGETWKVGNYAPKISKGDPAEAQVVELSDGSILINARSRRDNKLRKVAISEDGGQHWSPLVDDPSLIEPQCQGSILRYTSPLDGQKSRILFANPASQEARINGTVRLSYDEGQTWPVSKTIYAGSFAYSCLTALPDGTIGLLYERDNYTKITLARFNLAWLTDNKDVIEPR